MIVKGLRVASDFENELQMAQMNRQMSGIDTVLIPTASSSSYIASKYVSDFAASAAATVDSMVSPRRSPGDWRRLSSADEHFPGTAHNPPTEQPDAETLMRASSRSSTTPSRCRCRPRC